MNNNKRKSGLNRVNIIEIPLQNMQNRRNPASQNRRQQIEKSRRQNENLRQQNRNRNQQHRHNPCLYFRDINIVKLDLNGTRQDRIFIGDLNDVEGVWDLPTLPQPQIRKRKISSNPKIDMHKNMEIALKRLLGDRFKNLKNHLNNYLLNMEWIEALSPIRYVTHNGRYVRDYLGYQDCRDNIQRRLGKNFTAYYDFVSSDRERWRIMCKINVKDRYLYISNLFRNEKKGRAISTGEKENMSQIGPMSVIYNESSFDIFDIPYFENDKDEENIFFKKDSELCCKDGEILEKKNGTKSFVRVLFEDIDSIYKFEIEKNSSNSHKTKEKLRQAENKFKEDFSRFLELDKKQFSIMTTEDKNGTEFNEKASDHNSKADIKNLKVLLASETLSQKIEAIKIHFESIGTIKAQEAFESLEQKKRYHIIL